MLRLLKVIADSGMWKPVGKVHGWLYDVSGGRIGASAAGITNMRLTTTGRRSGEPRTVTLAYMADGDDQVLVASNGGSDHPPAWYLNLRDNPNVSVQIGGKRIDAQAYEVEGDERARLWPELKRYNPMYANYEKITQRRIPVVVVRRRGQ